MLTALDIVNIDEDCVALTQFDIKNLMKWKLIRGWCMYRINISDASVTQINSVLRGERKLRQICRSHTLFLELFTLQQLRCGGSRLLGWVCDPSKDRIECNGKCEHPRKPAELASSQD